jgi:hypothetical protein
MEIITKYIFSKNDNFSLTDYKKFQQNNKELFDNTKYFVIKTGYTYRFIEWDEYKGKYNNIDSIIAIEAKNDSTYCGDDMVSSNFEKNDEGKYLLKNFSEYSGWVGFKSNKNIDLFKCINILSKLEYCLILNYMATHLEIVWYKLPNNDIVAYFSPDTESE